MIGCDVFKKKLQLFLEGMLSDSEKSHMEGHKRECQDCSRLYDEEKAVDMILTDALLNDGIEFKSRRESVLKSIDKNRYKEKAGNKLWFYFRRNLAAYMTSVILVVICVFSYPAIAGIISPARTVPGDSTIKQEDSVSKDTQNKAPLIIREAEFPLPENVADSEAAGILNRAKDEDMGVDPWTIAYSGGGRVIFYNSPGLLAYSNEGGKGEYYGAVDLQKIGCNYRSGETITLIEPSPDGSSVVIWNWDVEALVNGNSNVYVYDLPGKKSKIFKRDDKADIVGAWSKSSQYYAFGDKLGKQMTIYDTKQDREMYASFNMGLLKQAFISDSGDVIAVSDKNYIIKNINNKYVTQELPISGEILGFTQSGGIAYFENGAVCEYQAGKGTVLKEIGSKFKLSNSYIFTGVRNMEHPMFSDGTYTILYDLDKSFYSYDFGSNSGEYVRFSEDSTKCFVTVDFMDAEVKTSNGKTARIKSDGSTSDVLVSSFFDNQSLIRITQKKGSTKLGDFVLVKGELIQ